MSLIIVGAGMAGLLAANLLRHYDPIVVEEQKELPNNHTALLRFRSSIVGDATGIPFRKVTVVKHVEQYMNSPVASALAYAKKVAGLYTSDRSILRGNEVVERYIAPDDLLERLAKNVKIEFGVRYAFNRDEKVLSTIPMPALMNALDYPKRVPFYSNPGFNIRATVRGANAYATVYVPDPDVRYSRVSITGDELIVECPGTKSVGASAEVLAARAAKMLGISHSDVENATWYEQKYAKILPIDDRERKDFIHWASVTRRKAFSLGRFATWRPWLMTDDLVQDIRLIDSWIRDGYAMDLHHGRS